jgi:uncharacterized protein
MIKLDFSTIVRKLQAFNFPKVDLVIGIENGGIVPAALIAYQLGKGVAFISINYRDIKNNPQHTRPVLLEPFAALSERKKVLVVDDASMTGETLKLAKKLLKAHQVKTFVLKGKADYVLFPAIKDCVDWPWKKLIKE